MKLGIPSKGRLKKEVIKCFNNKGIKILTSDDDRSYAAKVADFPNIQLVLVPPTEIPSLLLKGDLDLGVTGQDLIEEKIPEWKKYVKELIKFGIGHADLVIAVPEFWIDVNNLEDLDDVANTFRRKMGFRLRIATKYHNLARKYLKEFLSDRRVIEVNPIIWQVILNLFILTFRPSKSAHAYKQIWMKEINESPLRFYTKNQKDKLSKRISNKNLIVDFAMRYGNPSIEKKLKLLKNSGCENIVIFPLYPQYASATTATVCDEVYRTLMKMRWQPSLQIIPHYESEPLYIKALVNSIEKKISEIRWTPDLIVASYHGIPKKYFEKGDPYHCYCMKTTRLLKEKFKSIDLIIDRFISSTDLKEEVSRITDSVETALYEGKQECKVITQHKKSKDITEKIFSSAFEENGKSFIEPTTHLFSFNNPLGACPSCEGFGRVIGIDEDVVIPNKSLSVYQDAIAPWKGEKMSKWRDDLIRHADKFNFPIHRAIDDLTKDEYELLWSGNKYFKGLNFSNDL